MTAAVTLEPTSSLVGHAGRAPSSLPPYTNNTHPPSTNTNKNPTLPLILPHNPKHPHSPLSALLSLALQPTHTPPPLIPLITPARNPPPPPPKPTFDHPTPPRSIPHLTFPLLSPPYIPTPSTLPPQPIIPLYAIIPQPPLISDPPPTREHTRQTTTPTRPSITTSPLKESQTAL